MNVLFWVLTFLGGFVGGIAGKTAYLFFSKHSGRRRDKRFLRFVRITLPESKVIEVISVGPSKKQVIENVERKIRNESRYL